MPNPSATLTETPKTFRLRSSSLPLYRCSSILRCHISRTCRLFLPGMALVRFGNKFPKHRNIPAAMSTYHPACSVAGFAVAWRPRIATTASRIQNMFLIFRCFGNLVPETNCPALDDQRLHIKPDLFTKLVKTPTGEWPLLWRGDQSPSNGIGMNIVRCFGNLFPKRTPSLRSIKGCASCPTLPPRSQKRRKRSGYAVVACPCIDVLPSYGVILAALAGCSYPAWHLFVSGTSSRNTEENVILAALAGYPCWRWCLSVSGTSSRNTERQLENGHCSGGVTSPLRTGLA